MTEKRTFNERDFHAYIDGELDTGTQLEVEAWLESHPEDKSLVETWQLQREALKNHLDPVLKEPISDQLVAELRSKSARLRVKQWSRIAAGILIFVLGGAGGWFLSQQYSILQQKNSTLANSEQWPALAVQAISAHTVFVADRGRPVEVRAKNEGENMRWLSKRFGQTLVSPNLSNFGWKIIGGRVLPLQDKAGAQFMYQNKEGKRLTIFLGGNPERKEATYQYWRKGKVGCYYWYDHSVGIAVAGDSAKEELRKISESVYDHFEVSLNQ